MRHQKYKAPCLSAVTLAVSVVLAAMAAPAQAVTINTGESDFKLRWDNTVK